MNTALIGSAAYLYPLAIQQAEALARTPSTAKLLTFSRGLESLRPEGRELDLCRPDTCAETAHDGREVAYLRAGDGD